MSQHALTTFTKSMPKLCQDLDKKPSFPSTKYLIVHVDNLKKVGILFHVQVKGVL